MSEAFSPFAQRVIDGLSPDLGTHTAKQALKLVCKRAKCAPPRLAGEHVDTMRTVLRPMLRTLLGGARTELLIEWIAAGVLPPP